MLFGVSPYIKLLKNLPALAAGSVKNPEDEDAIGTKVEAQEVRLLHRGPHVVGVYLREVTVDHGHAELRESLLVACDARLIKIFSVGDSPDVTLVDVFQQGHAGVRRLAVAFNAGDHAPHGGVPFLQLPVLPMNLLVLLRQYPLD